MQKLVQKFGNSAHIILPREMIGKKVRLLLATRTFNDIKEEVLKFLNPHLHEIIALYLYGSYSRQEPSKASDIDILVIAEKPIKINHQEYTFACITLNQLKEAAEKTPVLILPIIREAITIINPEPLSQYKSLNLTKANTQYFIKDCKAILATQKKGTELAIGTGSLVYSLILRLRSLYIIKTWSQKQYTKSGFLNFLEKTFNKNEVDELYQIYSSERAGLQIKTSNIIKKEHLQKLLIIMEKLIRELS
ncbi:MAG TPA: DUF2080 family transposase-associated protein [Candidatus Nanoarchaeia archaeon]|nr:DUF2080 family transposase-associated protein [Candidatus Nanoarchaeia archaeon]